MQASRIALSLALALAPALFAAEDPSPQHVAWMKETGKLNGMIRKGAEVEASAKRLAELWGGDVSKFWSPRSEIAKSSSSDLVAAAKALAASTTPEAIAENSKKLGATCRSCHTQHREEVSQGVYKIK